MFRPKIGLALGGGGPKGLAHIGVIKILEKNNIPIDFIAGTSVGAMVGGMYAYSKNIESLEKHFIGKNWLQMLSYFADPSLKSGLIQGKRMEEFLKEYLEGATFEKVKIPFQATAVDLQTGMLNILEEGSLCTAIRASCAIPMIFQPVKMNDHLYVDGGLLSNVPVKAVKKMGADIVIAVQLNKYYSPDRNLATLNMLEVGELALSIVERSMAESEIKGADFTIQPKLTHVHWDNFIQQENRENGILLGEDAASSSITQIQLKLAENNIGRILNRWATRIKRLF